MHKDMCAAANLSDEALLARLADLAGRERHATVELVAHLAEFDARGLYRARGHGSLFSYCTEALRLSEHAAYKRIEAARIARMFPVVLERLADGSVNLATLRLVGPHLRPDGHLAVLGQAAGLSKREVQALVARLAPQPDVVASVRKLPSPPPSRTPFELPIGSPTPVEGPTLPLEPRDAAPVVPVVVGAGAPAPNSPGRVPAAGRYRVQFTIGTETHENLRVVQDLLRREVQDGDVGVIFDRALRLLRADIERKKLGAALRPQIERERSATSRRVAGVIKRSRHIPAAIKRSVWVRDQGRCAFIASGGRRCSERAYLEFHHLEPFAIGGEATARNIALRCRSHNVHEAERVFGPDTVARRRGEVEAATRSGASWTDGVADPSTRTAASTRTEPPT